ncbi:TPR-like protein [Mycena latifolia]|nr:TPR-like protein [Mycena latifolia]
MLSQGPLDLLELWVMHERILLLSQYNGTRAGCLNILGDICLESCTTVGTVDGLNQGVCAYADAVRDDPTSAMHLSGLGGALYHRFEQLGNVVDINQGRDICAMAVKMTPDDDPSMALRLTTLGGCLFQCFEQLGNLIDLNESVSTFKAAVNLTPEGHPDMPYRLSNLGNSLLCRFGWLGELNDLNESVFKFQTAVSLTPEGDPGIPSLLSNLGNSLLSRFERLGDLPDLNESVSKFKAAVSLTPEGHPDMPSRLNNFGNSLISRFGLLGDLNDLNESVDMFDTAVTLTPEGHPKMPSWLNNLGNSLFRRFERLGNLTDLNDSVAMLDTAVTLTPEGHPEMPSQLNNLGNPLLRRFDRLGDLADLNEAVSTFKAAVSLTPEGHPDMPSRLNNFGNSLLRRFDRLDALTDLNESVSTFRAAVSLTPEGQPDTPSQLNNFGKALLNRFERLGDVTDLNESVSTFRAAVSLTPEVHPNKPLFLKNLGNSLLSRFDRLGDLTDLNESVSTFRATITLTPEGHPDMPSQLNHLGNSLLSRFERFGDLTDLNESVSKFKTALTLTPEGHPDKPSGLSNLGHSLRCRFERLGDLTDLNESVSKFETAVALTPEGHPGMPSGLNNLGSSLLRRFEELGDPTDLNESPSKFKVAISLTPEGHPDKCSQLNNLGNSLRRRFQQLGDVTDLNESVSAFKATVNLTPEGHPAMSSCLINLGHCLHDRFNRLKDPRDCEDMLIQYRSAASSLTGSAQTRFHASRLWAHYAHSYKHPSLLHAYTTAVDLVPKVAWLGLSISDRHHQLLEAGTLVREAASAAINAQEYSKAVEWLEQGRSVIWGQVLNLRTPVDDLQVLHPKLAAELVSISNLLETSGTRSGIEVAGFRPSQSLQATAQQYHDLATRRDELLQEIRGLAGFERFLLPKLISELSQAAKMGPVVLLNTSSYHSDALILIPSLGDEAMHVPLPEFTLEQAQHLTEALGSLVRGAARSNRLDARREGELPPDEEFSWILSVLWMKIAPGRIWWCPTGPLAFLPIHAAGLYGQGEVLGSKLSDFLISSYTPSLSALIEGLHAKKESQERLQLLAVAQPSAFGQSHIPGTMKEIASIDQLAQGVIPVLHLEQDMATVENVQNGMRTSRWAHFACHGLQDIFKPTNSALLLAGDAKLTLSDIIQLQLPHADLAFLSACQTATGSKILEDESVHLTAGMLLAGYRGVIGTMWSMMDDDGPQVASDVYTHLFKTSPPDSMRAAEALHLAVQKLRDSDRAGGTKSFSRWVPFIHVGV